MKQPGHNMQGLSDISVHELSYHLALRDAHWAQDAVPKTSTLATHQNNKLALLTLCETTRAQYASTK